MEINYYEDPTLQNNRVDVWFREQDSEIQSLMAFLASEQIITGKKEQITKRILVKDIFYLEVVDRHCFAYLDNEVFQITCSLKVFLEKFQSNYFIQIGKSLVVNLHKIDKIKPDLNMRMHLILENGEELILNRAYKKSFMECLKNGGRKRDENH